MKGKREDLRSNTVSFDPLPLTFRVAVHSFIFGYAWQQSVDHYSFLILILTFQASDLAHKYLP